MAKKQSTAVAEANHRTSGDLSFTGQDAAAAQQLGIVIGGSASDRITRAVTAYNQAARLAVEAGYLLLSVKAEVEHGQFTDGVESLGLSQQRASELMRMAKFTSALPEDRRVELLSLPKSKVLALASADPSVVEQLLEDGEVSDLDDLSVRGLRNRIRELEAGTTDLAVQRDKAEADKKALEKQLKRRGQRDEDEAFVPIVIADIRAEGAALVKKAELAVNDMHQVGVELAGLGGHEEAGEWVAPSARLLLSGLVAVRMQLDGMIKSYADLLGEDGKRFAGQPDGLAFLDESEVKEVAEDWSRLTATHQHEAALRTHEREQARPKGKGRPKAAPEAPAKAKS